MKGTTMATKLTTPTITTVAEPRSPELSLMAWLGAASQHRKTAHEAARTAQKAGDHAGHVKWAKLETALADLIAATSKKG
jgi:hypothetical protein